MTYNVLMETLKPTHSLKPAKTVIYGLGLGLGLRLGLDIVRIVLTVCLRLCISTLCLGMSL